MSGGGGYGDPLERDPEGVLRDVVEEKVTPEHAEREYGVVLARDGENGGAWTLDLPATRTSARSAAPRHRLRRTEAPTGTSAYQGSTSRPATRENSPTLRVTSTCEVAMAMERDHEIVPADGPSFAAKLSPHDPVVPRRLVVEGQRLEGPAENLHPLQVFGEPGGILRPEMQLRLHDAAKADGAAGSVRADVPPPARRCG